MLRDINADSKKRRAHVLHSILNASICQCQRPPLESRFHFLNEFEERTAVHRRCVEGSLATTHTRHSLMPVRIVTVLACEVGKNILKIGWMIRTTFFVFLTGIPSGFKLQASSSPLRVMAEHRQFSLGRSL
jgi:hypothetical protein